MPTRIPSWRQRFQKVEVLDQLKFRTLLFCRTPSGFSKTSIALLAAAVHTLGSADGTSGARNLGRNTRADLSQSQDCRTRALSMMTVLTGNCDARGAAKFCANRLDIWSLRTPSPGRTGCAEFCRT